MNDLRLLVFARTVILASAIVTATLLGTRATGVIQPLEIAAFDWMMRKRPDAGPDSRMLLVGISEADIRRQKQWPLSDRVLAQLFTKLEKFQPRVIGLDIYRDIPEEPGHAELLAKFASSNIIAITNLGSSDKNRVPPPASVPKERVGFNDVVVDPDGAIRRNLIFGTVESQQEKQVFSSFAFRLAIAYLQARGIKPENEPNNSEVIWLGKARLLPLEANSGGYAIADAKGYQILLNYRTKSPIARTVTLTEVLNGQLDPNWVKDKIVLIGTTAPSAKDLYPTPYSVANKEMPKVPGVTIHAQMVSQFLDAATGDRALFWFWPEWGEALWIGGWSLAGGLLVALFWQPLRLGLAAIIGLGSLFGISFFLFTQSGWVPLVPPALAFAATGCLLGAYKVRYNALHDSLTGLPNRDFFATLSARQFSGGNGQKQEACAVLYLDLDNFKVINNSFGAKISAQLLVAIALRLRACLLENSPSETPKTRLAQFLSFFHPSSFFWLPTSVFLSRVGGDEFAIFLRDIPNDSAPIRLAQELLLAIAPPLHLNGSEVFTTASIGIAIGSIAEAPYLLRNAETAMYRARMQGRGRYQMFEDSILTGAVGRLQLENDMRRALERQEFLLHYQPLICLSTGKIIGFEALVRWQHPQRGMVSPAEFIPVAEETGLIIPLGAWIMREACRQMHIWHEKFPQQPSLVISINLSGKQFSQEDLLSQIKETLEQTEIEKSAVKLEITESLLMENMEAAIAILHQLRSIDIQLGIDDFGTGYSSLSYLHRFPANTLKVDRSFVSRLQDSGEHVEIVRTILNLAHTLNMDAIAEGVETAAQMEKLRSLGCEYGQGYFFAKPLPSAAAEELLASDPHW